MNTHPLTYYAGVAATLRQARAVIEEPQHWTKGTMARTSKRGESVSPDSRTAVVWCALGAIKKVDGPYEEPAIKALAYAISGWAVGERHVYIYNDSTVRRHSDVLKKFDQAIELLDKMASGVEVSNPPDLS